MTDNTMERAGAAVDRWLEEYKDDPGVYPLTFRSDGVLRVLRRHIATAIREAVSKPPHLFVNGEFTSHSGLKLPFKIDCDALTDNDLDTLAVEITRRVVRFKSVHGIPRGGWRLAGALRRYATGSNLDPVLIVDDVLTTGASMQEGRRRYGSNTIGVVIFARGPCSDWIVPLFFARPESAQEGGE